MRTRPILALTALGATVLGACSADGAPAAPEQRPTREVGALQLQVTAGAGGAPTATAPTPAPSAPSGGRPESPSSGTGGSSANVGSPTIEWTRPPQAGTINAPKVIEVADTVRVGQAVPIVVHTVLPDGCWRTDGEDVRQTGMTVEITPHDARSDAQVCTLIYAFGAHRTSATFTTPGTATIRVSGRLVREGTVTTSEPIAAQRTITVVR
jgi:hypothetical protein